MDIEGLTCIPAGHFPTGLSFFSAAARTGGVHAGATARPAPPGV